MDNKGRMTWENEEEEEIVKGTVELQVEEEIRQERITGVDSVYSTHSTYDDRCFGEEGLTNEDIDKYELDDNDVNLCSYCSVMGNMWLFWEEIDEKYGEDMYELGRSRNAG